MVNKIDMCDCNVIHEDVVITVKEQMPDENRVKVLAEFYKAFSDSTKVKILWALDISESSVTSITYRAAPPIRMVVSSDINTFSRIFISNFLFSVNRAIINQILTRTPVLIILYIDKKSNLLHNIIIWPRRHEKSF